MRKSIVFASLLGCGVILGLTLALTAPEPDERQSIEWLENPRSLPTFSLHLAGQDFDNAALSGRWTIVSFGFLQCADICPTNLSQLAALEDGLKKQSIDHKVDFVFVSVDPRRDSVAAVGEYARYFSPSFQGVTGTDAQLLRFSDALGIQYNVSVDRDNYSVAHSTTFSVIDADGLLRGRFRPGFDVTDAVKNLARALRAAST